MVIFHSYVKLPEGIISREYPSNIPWIVRSQLRSQLWLRPGNILFKSCLWKCPEKKPWISHWSFISIYIWDNIHKYLNYIYLLSHIYMHVYYPININIYWDIPAGSQHLLDNPRQDHPGGLPLSDGVALDDLRRHRQLTTRPERVDPRRGPRRTAAIMSPVEIRWEGYGNPGKTCWALHHSGKVTDCSSTGHLGRCFPPSFRIIRIAMAFTLW